MSKQEVHGEVNGKVVNLSEVKTFGSLMKRDMHVQLDSGNVIRFNVILNTCQVPEGVKVGSKVYIAFKLSSFYSKKDEDKTMPITSLDVVEIMKSV